MKRTRTLLIASSTALALVAGCADMSATQRGAATGAGAGALGGAALGALLGGGRGARTGAAIGTAVGAGGGYIRSKRMEDQKRTMEQATQGTGVQVTQTADNQLRLEVPSDVSFLSGRADIEPNFRPVLDRFVQTLTAHPDTTLRIIGDTDSTGGDVVNEPLSVNRAASVRGYPVERGVAAQRIAIDGRAAREPVADNASDAGRARNRRVEMCVGEPQVAQAPAAR
jgi:outer membrane protein OmpA-like peptidoglycan-associated protein